MKYQDLIDQMTLEEKISLLSGNDVWTTKSISSLGIESIMLSDGPHGVRKQKGASDHLGLNESIPATCFPTAATIANSWDIELAHKIGEALGEEARELDVQVLLGPGVNIKRNPLCGRNFEYFSEDPYLSGKMGSAYVSGIQTMDVAACPKHFAANSQELLRMANDSIVDQRALREIYLTAFEMIVKEAKNKMIMSSYNKINGHYTNEDAGLLLDILRQEWGYQGAVVTDWGGSNSHVEGVKNGSNLEMPGTNGDSDLDLLWAAQEGKISEQDINERVDELLGVIFSTLEGKKKKTGDFSIEKHHELAEKAAAESIVLLKNEGNILPLKKDLKIAVIGDFAFEPRYQGSGSSLVNPTKLDSTVTAIKQFEMNVIGMERGYDRLGRPSEHLVKSALEIAKKADVVLFFFGLDEISESEGLDRNHMRLPKNQVTLLGRLAEVNNNIIAVLSGGSAIEMPWIEQCKAVVHGYLGGQAGAVAMLKVLCGKVNPSGKLAETYPLSYMDSPSYHYYPGTERTSEYKESIYVGYRYYQKTGVKVRFPFGYGLSYTKFSYDGLKLNENGCSFEVTNTGEVDGSEICQLYIGKPSSNIFRAKQELKAFKKIFLKAGETRTVEFLFDEYSFRYFDVEQKQFKVEEGEYLIQIGSSSEDIRITAQMKKQGSRVEEEHTADQEHLPSYWSGKITNISNTEFEKLLGMPIPEKNWRTDKVLEINDTIAQLNHGKSLIGRLVWKILTSLKNNSIKKGKPNLNILFIYNMPFRGLAKMTGGAVNKGMSEGILEVVNGKFFKGVKVILRERKFRNGENKKLKEILAQQEETRRKSA